MTVESPAVYLALGSNLGDRQRNLAMALLRLETLVRVEAVSSLYETDPVGPQEQPPFLNAACRVRTDLAPAALLQHAQDVERELGRRAGPRWGPRPIDIDILLYGDEVIEEPGLRVPHPELAGRPFVLIPLAELAAGVRHPLLGRTIESLAEDVERGSVRRRAPLGWERK